MTNNRFYEIVFIARSELTTQQIINMINDFSKLIEELGGKLDRYENWGLKSLAYKIKKRSKGIYVLLYVELPTSAVKTLDHKLKMTENILRHLIINVEELSKEPSVMVSQKQKLDSLGKESNKNDSVEEINKDVE